MRSTPCLLVLVLLASMASPAFSSQKAQPERPERVESDDVQERFSQKQREVQRSELERQFAEKLTGSALVGNFTVDGQSADKPPKAERYEISKARKVEGDTWEITARIKYGQVDLQVPIQLDVLWAGDTPVMSLTDLRIPLMEGSFTARVLFYGDRYVGTWQHGKAGGHMFGHVERAGEENGADSIPVSGVILLDGVPVADATVEFIPAGGKRKSVSGKTDEKGRFKLKLAAGKHVVGIRPADDGQRRADIPARYSGESSPLTVEVKAGPNEFKFALTSR